MGETKKLQLSVKEEKLLHWRRRNSYYYGWLEKIYKFVVRPNSRVLHVGCECGDLLEAVEPSYGVGVDINPEAIELAKKRFGHLEFHVADPHELNLEENFDYILICNSLGQWSDIQQVLEHIRPMTNENTRIIITYYNHLWEGILRIGSFLGIRSPNSYQNWLPPKDIENLLYLSDFDVIRTDSYLMLPKRIPFLAGLFNYFLSLLPFFRFFNLVNLVIARPKPLAKRDEDLSVSVIIPCKNECGNIGDAIERIEPMGRETEIIFIDGNISRKWSQSFV